MTPSLGRGLLPSTGFLFSFNRNDVPFHAGTRCVATSLWKRSHRLRSGGGSAAQHQVALSPAGPARRPRGCRPPGGASAWAPWPATKEGESSRLHPWRRVFQRAEFLLQACEQELRAGNGQGTAHRTSLSRTEGTELAEELQRWVSTLIPH